MSNYSLKANFIVEFRRTYDSFDILHIKEYIIASINNLVWVDFINTNKNKNKTFEIFLCNPVDKWIRPWFAMQKARSISIKNMLVYFWRTNERLSVSSVEQLYKFIYLLHIVSDINMISHLNQAYCMPI